VTPDFAALDPGFQPKHSKPSRPLPVIIDRQHLAADRLGRVGGEEHRQRRDVLRLDHRLDRLRGHPRLQRAVRGAALSV
jgi:hypothetical protein